jgi:tetratricopeptide (TPR) repeat protein
VVVGLPGSRDGFVITADRGFAALRGVSPETLAYDILDTIRATVDPPPLTSRAPIPDSKLNPAGRLKRANLYREGGDDAYSAGNKDLAEKDYLHATRLAPQYAVPYLRLGNLYIEEQEYKQAVDMVRRGEKWAHMDADQRSEAQKILAQAQSAGH